MSHYNDRPDRARLQTSKLNEFGPKRHYLETVENLRKQRILGQDVNNQGTLRVVGEDGEIVGTANGKRRGNVFVSKTYIQRLFKNELSKSPDGGKVVMQAARRRGGPRGRRRRGRPARAEPLKLSKYAIGIMRYTTLEFIENIFWKAAIVGFFGQQKSRITPAILSSVVTLTDFDVINQPDPYLRLGREDEEAYQQLRPRLQNIEDIGFPNSPVLSPQQQREEEYEIYNDLRDVRLRPRQPPGSPLPIFDEEEQIFEIPYFDEDDPEDARFLRQRSSNRTSPIVYERDDLGHLSPVGVLQDYLPTSTRNAVQEGFDLEGNPIYVYDDEVPSPIRTLRRSPQRKLSSSNSQNRRRIQNFGSSSSSSSIRSRSIGGGARQQQRRRRSANSSNASSALFDLGLNDMSLQYASPTNSNGSQNRKRRLNRKS